MIHAVRTLNALLVQFSGTLLLAGVAGVAWHNYRLWQRDKVLLKEKVHTVPLRPPEMWPRRPTVSVLVAAWNEEANVERHVRSFGALRYPHRELILCAGGRDRTYAVAAGLTGDRVTVLEQRLGEGKQRALRRCLERARGTVVFLTDADCLFDDDSFERTIYPVVTRRERVCTGGSRPYPEMKIVPFVVAQAVPQLYNSYHGTPYAPGLLGRNCAIDRRLLEACRGLDAPAPTGTDYVLAKTIDRAGVRIRQVPESRIATEYPITVQEYVRQRRRWLRNVALYGWRFGARDEVRASLTTSAVGLGMLALPVSAAVFGRISVVAWLVLLTHAFLSRLRYLHFATAVEGFHSTWQHVVFQIPALFLDFVAWSRPLLDYVVRGGENEW